jgi:hypothetical protein
MTHPAERAAREGAGSFDHQQALGDGVRTEIAFLLHVRLHSVEGRGQQRGVQRRGRGRIAGVRQELLGVRAEVREGPGELGRRLDHALREVLVGASRSECIIAALAPMPAGPVRIKTEHFFPFDLDAEGGPPMWLFRHRKGQQYRRRSPAWDNGRIRTRPTEDSPSIMVAIATRLD